LAKEQIKKSDATLETFNDFSRTELSDLIDNIINNISKISNERDFFYDYFKNIETQIDIKNDKDFVKNVVYKKSNSCYNTLGENMGNKINTIVNPKNPIIDSTNRPKGSTPRQDDTNEFQMASK
jgi:hypothetical protein